MSNINLIIEERPRSIGSFMVGRLLPFSGKRMVGPFIFIDHMGPVHFSAQDNSDVPPHPHIGLSTLTYLFEGSIMHRDSLGTEIEITPGQVNWMTAGAGIVHSERTPASLKGKERNLHGLQIWVALPAALEDMAPGFYHATEEELPHWKEGNVSFKLIAGKAFGRTSPVPVHSELFLIEIKSDSVQTLNIGQHLFGESGMYILEGSVESEGNRYESKQILVAKESSLCAFTIAAHTTIYIFGGLPFPEERMIYWNFVATNAERIEKAKIKWLEQKFPRIHGETEFVPLPTDHK